MTTKYNGTYDIFEHAMFLRRSPECLSVNFAQNNTLREKCCTKYHNFFAEYWDDNYMRLGVWLNYLYQWNCPQFQQECKSHTYNFSDYTNKLYLRFCKPREYYEECKSHFQDAAYIEKESLKYPTFPETIATGDSNFTNISMHSDNTKLLKYPLEPCVQASLVKIGNNSMQLNYVEVKDVRIPFCKISWCAFRSDDLKTKDLSLSLCMPSMCQVNLYILMVVAGLMGTLILLANAIVVIVLSKIMDNNNSQRIYKMSLALSDFLAGLVVMPSVIIIIRQSFFQPEEIYHSIDEQGRKVSEMSEFPMPYWFLNMAGFFTTMSLSISIYTLTLASFDRLLVVYRPLAYNKYDAINRAKTLVVITWIAGCCLGLVPFIFEGVDYSITASWIVLFEGEIALIVYSVALCLPLLLMWGTTISTLVLFKRNKSSSGQCLDDRNLMKTLSIMTGVFSLCLVPSLLLMLCTLLLEGTDIDDPRYFKHKQSMVLISMEAVTGFILTSNNLWNFFIYNSKAEFRSQVRLLYQRQFQKIRGKISRRQSNSSFNSRNASRPVLSQCVSSYN
ncbi:uncharacterized protein LOC120346932 [Styela clava]